MSEKEIDFETKVERLYREWKAEAEKHEAKTCPALFALSVELIAEQYEERLIGTDDD